MRSIEINFLIVTYIPLWHLMFSIGYFYLLMLRIDTLTSNTDFLLWGLLTEQIAAGIEAGCLFITVEQWVQNISL